MKLFFLLSGLLSASAFSAILENTSAEKTTFYYFVNGTKVYIRQCEGEPSVDVDLNTCIAIASPHLDFSPMEVTDFRARVEAWTKKDLTLRAALIARAKSDIPKKQSLLAEVEAILKGIPQGSPTLPDYLDRKADLTKQIQQMEYFLTIAEAEAKAAEIIFGSEGYLSQRLTHPVAQGKSTYLPVRTFVKHFYDAFKYRNVADPGRSLSEAKADFARFKSEGKAPYCAYWNGTIGSSELTWRQSNIRMLITLNKKETVANAQKSCRTLGMELPAAEHIPAYHSNFWYEKSNTETWTAEKSMLLFAATDLGRSLPAFDYQGRKTKMFWVSIPWSPRSTKVDALQLSPSGKWFRYIKGREAMSVSPDWQLSVVCEKEYLESPQFVDDGDLPECSNFMGWR